MADRTQRRALLTALTLVLAGTAPASGQEPPVFGRREKPPPFALYNWAGYIELFGFREVDSATPKGGKTSTSSDTVLRETLGLSTDGHVVHPNLIDLRLAATLGLTQEIITDPTTSRTATGNFRTYDVSATFLRKEFAPLKLYAGRTDSVTTRQFGGALNSVQTVEGLNWQVRSKLIPTTFDLYKTSQTSGNLSGLTAAGVGPNTVGSAANQNSYRRDETVFQWHSDSRPTERHLLTWDYSHRDILETTGLNAAGGGTGTSLASKRDEATLADFYHFGFQDRSNIASQLNFYRDAGPILYERLRWNEDVRLQHTKDFRTNFRYLFNQDRQDNAVQTLRSPAAGFEHRLYGSLVTSGQIGLSQLDLPRNGQVRERFARIDWDYTKRVPYGLLGLNLGLAQQAQENDMAASPQFVRAEPHTFVDPDPIRLNRRNIDVSSIIVTGVGGFPTYTASPPLAPPLADYVITVFPDRVELARRLGGPIADNTPVEISYTILPEPPNTTTTRTLHFGGRYQINRGPLNGLAVYARQLKQDQSIVPLPPNVTPDSLVDRVFGVEYRIWHLLLTGERELHDSTLSPYNVTRLNGLLSYRGPGGLGLTLGANHAISDFRDDNTRGTFTTLSGRVEKQLNKRLFLGASINWRDELDRTGARTRGVDEQVELRWRYRQMQVYVLFRNVRLTTDTEQTNNQTLEAGLRRDF